MKPLLHIVPVQQQASFSVRHDVKLNFGTIWHYHPELELHYIIKGEGLRFVGDDINNFRAGDIVLLGQNLPHTWHCHEDYFREDSDKHIEAIVIQFLPDCFGKSFLSLPEAWPISCLFEKASKGLIITGNTRKLLSIEMLKMLDATGLERLVVLLKILEILTESKEYKTITTTHSFYNIKSSDYSRLNKIYNYTFTHYNREIALDCIASECSLSPSYFCRYFKQMTGKTYHEFLIEVRISIACRMLLEGRETIEQICYECGFNNLTNFFKYFKRLKKMTPAKYRDKFIMRDKAKAEYQSPLLVLEK